MKIKLILPFVLVAFCTGCRCVSFEQVHADGSRVKMTSRSLFSDATLKGLTVGTNGLRLVSGITEANAEAITATGEAAGNAAKAAIK